MSNAQPKVQALRRQLQQLQERHAAGALDDGAYRVAREALEQQILAAVVGTPPAAAPAAVAARTSHTGALVGGVAAVLLIVGGAAWWQSRQNTADAPVAAAAGGASASPHAMGRDEMAAMTSRLAERLKDRPDDVEGWAMLGRSYAAIGRPDDALAAYDRVLKLTPNDAAIMADYADALAVKNGRSLEGAPMQWIEKALKADPDNIKALGLAGTVAFNRGDFAMAVKHWDRAVKVGPPSHPIVAQLAEGAAEARKRGKLPAAPAQ